MALNDFLTAFNNDKYNAFKIDPLNTFNIAIDFMHETKTTTLLKRIDKKSGIPINNGKVDLSLLTQSVTIPKVKTHSTDTFKSLVGDHTVYTARLQPAETTTTITFLNTKFPIIDTFIIPWIEELKSLEWKPTYKYTTGTIIIDLSSHVGITYKLFGARPVDAGSYNPSQDLPGKPVRSVTFDFDFLKVECSCKKTDGLDGLLKKLGGKLLGKAKGAFGF